MTSVAPIPFDVELTRVGYGEDGEVLNRLQLGFMGAAAPASVIIGSELYTDPHMVTIESRFGIELADADFEALALKFFGRAARYAAEMDGQSVEWSIADATAFLHRAIGIRAATYLVEQFSRTVTMSKAVSDCVIVSEDDNDAEPSHSAAPVAQRRAKATAGRSGT